MSRYQIFAMVITLLFIMPVMILNAPLNKQDTNAQLTTCMGVSDMDYNEHSQNALAPQYDLLIIAPSMFNSTLAGFVAHKNSLGINTILVNLEDIPDYPEGRDLQEDMKLFIKYGKENLGIKYVILGGDADVLPPRYCYLPEVWSPVYPNENNYTPCDLYYADLYTQNGSFCSWDANGNNVFGEFGNATTWTQFWSDSDQIDGVPDVALGRLPAGNVTEMALIVNKIINYEAVNHTLEPWFNNITLIGGNTFSGNGYEGEEHCDYIYRSFMNGYRKITVYEGSGTSDSPYFLNPENVTAAINNGSKFVAFACHGNYSYLGTQEGGILPVYNSEDIANLTNKEKLPVITFFSCDSAGFDCGVNYSGEDCIAERFLLWENGGAIATIGSTRVTWVLSDANLVDSRFYEQCANETGLLGDCFREAIANLSDLFYYRNFPSNDTYFPPNPSVYAVLVEHVLLGDPTLNLAPNPKIPTIRIVSPSSDRINGNTTCQIVWEIENETPNATVTSLSVFIEELPYVLFNDLPSNVTSYYWYVPSLQHHNAYFRASVQNTLTGKITYYQSPGFLIDSISPELLFVSPGDKEMGVSLLPDINLGFSEPMNTSSVIDAFSLIADGNKVPCSLVSYSTSSFIFRPDVQLKEDTWCHVTVSTIARDTSVPGLHIQSNYTWKFRTLVNTTNPVYVLSCSPTGSSVPLNSNITIHFSQRMNTSSIPDSIEVSPSIPYNVFWDENGTLLTLDALANFAPLTNYTVSVKAWTLKSQDGNYITTDFSWNFTTSSSVDITPPCIRHIPVTHSKYGDDIKITAYITDESGILTAKLYYKGQTQTNWSVILMFPDANGNYSAVIPGDAVPEEGIMYFIEAIDSLSNMAHAPSQAPQNSCMVYVYKTTSQPPSPNPVADEKLPYFYILLLLISIISGALIVGFAWKRTKKPQQPKKDEKKKEMGSEKIQEEPETEESKLEE
ncbi:MAG: C25 family cysteine peptidase [Thermoplasmata archaeon]